MDNNLLRLKHPHIYRTTIKKHYVHSILPSRMNYKNVLTCLSSNFPISVQRQLQCEQHFLIESQNLTVSQYFNLFLQ